MTLRTEQIRTLDQIRAFLDGSELTDFRFTGRDSAYDFVRRTLVRFEFHGLKRDEKGLVKRFIEKVTGYSRSQITRLIRQHRRTGGIRDHRKKPPAKPFPCHYTPYDAALLAEADEAFGQLSGPATKVVLWCMYHVYGDRRFKRLAGISGGHIYNLRKGRAYRTGRLTLRETRSTPVGFGVRRKPRPDGRPGFLRVDTVHLGDLGDRKGAYVINVVDEVTQFQHLGAVPRITQHFMVPVLKDLISAFPFTVKAFHADNGSEYINREVADLLNRLHIPAFTKSRPRRSNDNALVESKNGSIVRQPKARSATSTSPTISSPSSTPSSATASAPASTSTGPASSPPRSPAPAAASGRPTGRTMSPHPTSTSDPSPAPKTSSGPASPSKPSTNSLPPPPTSTPPRPCNAPAMPSSVPSARPETPPHEILSANRRLTGDPPASPVSARLPVASLRCSGDNDKHFNCHLPRAWGSSLALLPFPRSGLSPYWK